MQITLDGITVSLELEKLLNREFILPLEDHKLRVEELVAIYNLQVAVVRTLYHLNRDDTDWSLHVKYKKGEEIITSPDHEYDLDDQAGKLDTHWAEDFTLLDADRKTVHITKSEFCACNDFNRVKYLRIHSAVWRENQDRPTNYEIDVPIENLISVRFLEE